MIGLERCADCRRICTCYQDCVCSTLDDTGTLRCHDCTDAHDNAGTIERPFPAEGVAKLAAYIECALWSSTGEDGEPLDGSYGPDDLADETRRQMYEDVSDFLESNALPIGKCVR